MPSSQLNIRVKRPDRYGRSVVLVSHDEKVIEPTYVKVFDDRDRREFAKRFCEDHAGVDETEFLEKLVEGIGMIAVGEDTASGSEKSDLYEVREDGLYWNRSTINGIAPVRLANFGAHIKSEIIHDDGVDTERYFEIEIHIRDHTCIVIVSANRFPAIHWITEKLGSRAIVEAGLGIADRLRVAILTMSRDVHERRVFTHTGWRDIDGKQYYLHSGGGIGSEGLNSNVSVELSGSLARFELPDPPIDEILRTAICSSLALLDLGPDSIMFPLYAAVWRSVLPQADFSIFLAGPSGAFKSEIAALLQQHFGSGFIRSRLPGHWSGTENALETLAFTAKDALLVIDDFAPSGTMQDVARLNKTAERLIRAQGNHSGRLRCRTDGSNRPEKPPRGLVFATGEEVPRGQSIRARMVVVEVGTNDINADLLTKCQQTAAQGLYAQAMSGCLKWLAGRYEVVRDNLQRELHESAAAMRAIAFHRRTPMNAANLQIGFKYFLQFALECGAISKEKHDAYGSRASKALLENTSAQSEHHDHSNPAPRFLELLASAISGGQAHFAAPDGSVPDESNPGASGWRRQEAGTGMYQATHVVPLGKRVGWIIDGDIYLDWNTAYQVVQESSQRSGEGICVTSQTLLKRLHEQGYLKTVERGLKVRRQVEGQRPALVHLSIDALYHPENLPNLPTLPIGVYNPSNDRSYDDVTKTETCPHPTGIAQHAESVSDQFTGTSTGSGQDGQVGQVSGTIGASSGLNDTKALVPHPDDVPADLLDQFEEQAAKHEFEGGMTRTEAEQLAKKQVLAMAGTRKDN